MSDFDKRLEMLSPERQALLKLLLEEKRRTVSEAPILARRKELKDLPLSFAQERMWFLDQLESGSAFYNIHKAINLTGRVNPRTLEQCLNEILRRHEALRTIFTTIEGQPVQHIASTQSLTLPLVELGDRPEEERESIAVLLAHAEAQRPFDVAHGPLVRASLLRLTPEKHLLLLSLHHIISDGWSMGVLVKELGALYAAFNGGHPSTMPELSIQYADYALWQREWLQGERLEKRLAYWKRQLHDAPSTVDLPTDRERQMVGSLRGARERFSVSKEVSEALKRLSQQAGVSLFMTLLAGFQALLYRQSGQPDIVVGTRIAGRTRVEIEKLIGFFINALVLRTNVGGNPTFRELLERTQQSALGGFENQDVPFEMLVKELQPKRSLNYTPLFNVMFVLQNAPMPSLETPGLTITPVEVESTTAKYDLDLTLWESEAGLGGWLEYNTDLFAGETIKRLLERFERVLETVVTNPGCRVEELPLLSEAEQRQLLVEFNNTAAAYPREQSVTALFEAQVERTPDAVAVVDGEQELSYAALNRRANQLARYLRSRGVGAEVPVGVLLPRTGSLLVTLLGIFKAGGVYVPLDPAYPVAHQGRILEQTQAPVVVTQAGLGEQLALEQGAKLLRLDDEWEQIAEQEGGNLGVVSGLQQLVYVMYTSGSTGEPKGVAVEQQQLLNRLWWMWQRYPFAAGEVLCQRTTLNFSVSMWELLGGLLGGVRTVLVGDEVVQEVPRLVGELRRQEVTRIVLVPSLLRLLLEVEPELGARLPQLQLWTVCGEPLAVELYEQFRAQVPGATLLNQYGASEMNDVSCHELNGETVESAQDQSRSVSIGRPINNLRVYLLDWELRPVGLGTRGEIYVQSESPARGYLAMPETTAERFVPDHISGAAGGRLYRMGDLARYLPDGRLEHLGRWDHQVKIRGMRVELRGIETVLRKHPEIAEAVVQARAEHEGGELKLAAYVVRKSNSLVAVSELRRYLREQLAEYMVPAAIVFLEAMPLLPNKKIDRRALPDPRHVLSDGPEETYLPPQTKIEKTIAGIWQAVLDVEKVGLQDNFFDLGGHSLAVARVQSKLREAFAKDISILELFRNPTVSSLARFFNEEQVQELSLHKVADRGTKRKQMALLRHTQRSQAK